MVSLKRDYILAVDASSSMGMKLKSGLTRWESVAEAAFGLAMAVEKLDPDGIEVYTFASKVKEFGNATAQTIADIFRDQEPFGSTNLTALLDLLLLKKWQAEVPMTLLVITDGQPDDKASVAQTLIKATQRMSADEQLAISFVQVGDDPGATSFLTFLDDELVQMGAKFDIVDTFPASQFGDRPISELLLAAIQD
ncbi:MAG: hypothetical protein EA001_14390 [Oscillatoriales cyanobacterium]|nr:MAG: hypothetical protein EA001_14390 [Oscillatoriales cyanobacterium]